MDIYDIVIEDTCLFHGVPVTTECEVGGHTRNGREIVLDILVGKDGSPTCDVPDERYRFRGICYVTKLVIVE